MAARATRSASGAASSSDDASRCLLLALSHDELGVVVDGLADPLQPVVAVALSSTCLGLRTPLQAALEVLKERHARAKALCVKVDQTDRFRETRVRPPIIFAELPHETDLNWLGRNLTAGDMATLGTLLPWMPRLHSVVLDDSSFDGDEGMQALCEGLGPGTLPALTELSICGEGPSWLGIGPAGAEALAAALRRGAMPKIEYLFLSNSKLPGDQGAALFATLKKCPALKLLDLGMCGIGDEGVASLVDKLGKDDFKALKKLDLDGNLLTDVGCAKLVAALSAGALPAIEEFYCKGNAECLSEHASKEACAAVDLALQKRARAREAKA